MWHTKELILHMQDEDWSAGKYTLPEETIGSSKQGPGH